MLRVEQRVVEKAWAGFWKRDWQEGVQILSRPEMLVQRTHAAVSLIAEDFAELRPSLEQPAPEPQQVERLEFPAVGALLDEKA